MNNWLICNATLVNEGQINTADIRIQNGRIAHIGQQISAHANEQIFDAQGRYLLPGLIDDQVHFREPGAPQKGSIYTESRAAVAGGITSFMDMPNTNPQTITHARLAEKYAVAAQSSTANYAFYLGATNDNLSEIQKLRPGQACGVKIFMGASTGNMLVDNPEVLSHIFRDAPVLIATHCENSIMIQQNIDLFKQQNQYLIENHHLIRSAAACLDSTQLAIELATRHDARLHVLHLTTAAEVALFPPGPLQQKRITAETCVHFLHFDATDYPQKGNWIKCNPAIKTPADRAAIIQGVKEGRVNILATDHAPHTQAEKQQDYAQAPSGLPLVQHALVCALERVAAGDLTLETIVERFCHAPAQLFGVHERGFVREGYYADLVLVDMQQPQIISNDQVLAQVGWSPFAGEQFSSSVAATWVNGQLAWDGEQVNNEVRGMALVTTRGRD